MVRPRRPASAFTLAELLVVMSVIVILISVGTPAFKGLMGGRSRVAASAQVLTTLERARSTALEQGTSVYVGFATNANGFGGWPKTPMFAYSRFIVFRDRLETDSGPTSQTLIPLSGWQELPAGVVFGAYSVLDAGNAEQIDGGANLFPPVPGAVGLQQYPLCLLKYNSAGAVERPASGGAEVWLLDGLYRPDGSFVSTSKSGNTTAPADRIRIARYTGRAQLDTMPKP